MVMRARIDSVPVYDTDTDFEIPQEIERQEKKRKKKAQKPAKTAETPIVILNKPNAKRFGGGKKLN